MERNKRRKKEISDEDLSKKVNRWLDNMGMTKEDVARRMELARKKGLSDRQYHHLRKTNREYFGLELYIPPLAVKPLSGSINLSKLKTTFPENQRFLKPEVLIILDPESIEKKSQ